MKQDEELTMEERLERARRRRSGFTYTDKMRAVLNTSFMLLAAVGLVIYFYNGQNHVTALCVIGAGMLIKIVDFLLRLLF